MTVLAPQLPSSASARLWWVLRDGWTLARRELLHWRRNPTYIIGALAFPVLSILLFGYVFGSAMVVPGGGEYLQFLMPGMFAMTMVFGLGNTAIGVATDASRGITDRFRSMPMSQSGVVLGRSIADMINSLGDLVGLIVAGTVVGWRMTGSVGQSLAAVGLLLLLRFSVKWVGIYLGLLVPNPETVGALYGLLFPLVMIANTFVAPELMPGWLGTIAEWNPMSATVTATRELFGSPGLAGGGAWVTQNAMLMAVVWPLVLIAVFFPLSVYQYRRLSR
jgi:ABC-2 type transport system permease protein